MSRTNRGDTSITMKTKPRSIHIDLSRKLMSHNIIDQLRDSMKAKGMLSGSAVTSVLDEYDRMRYLMEGLVTAYERDNEADVRKVLETLRILL